MLRAARMKAFSYVKIATRTMFVQELKAFQKIQDKDATKIPCKAQNVHSAIVELLCYSSKLVTMLFSGEGLKWLNI